VYFGFFARRPTEDKQSIISVGIHCRGEVEKEMIMKKLRREEGGE
jgi:hypothetical protein